MFSPQQIVGPFRLRQPIGRGGVAEVWLADHLTLGSAHAIKFLTIQTVSLQERLLLEGRLQAMLAHPNVVSVTDVVRDNGRVGLVMEWVKGPTLEQWLRDDWSAAAIESMFRGICAGVRAAHARGLVHRDLKPANVLLVRNAEGWTPKVSDFGIARVLAEGQGTKTGSILGTLRYMAPEQLRDASRVDQRADIWALGCILYEMLARKPVIQASDLLSAYDTLRNRAWQPLGVAALSATPSLVRAAEAALQFDPLLRPESIDALLAYLDEEQTAPTHAARQLGDLRLDARVGGTDDVQVWRAIRPDGGLALVKMAPKRADALSLARVQREARLGTHAGTRSVPAELRADRLADCDVVACVRDWVPGQTLEDDAKFRRFTRDEVLDRLDALLVILEGWHAQSPPLVHRDLNLSHLVAGPSGLVVIGLGRARETLADPDFGGNTAVGEFGWQAPEQHVGDATPATDVYAAAVVAVALFTRREPSELLDARGSLRWTEHADLPQPIVAVITRMLAQDPLSRPTATEARLALADARSGGVKAREEHGGTAQAAVRPASETVPSTSRYLASRRGLLVASIALFAGAASAAAFSWSREPAPGQAPVSPGRPAGFFLHPAAGCPQPSKEAMCAAAAASDRAALAPNLYWDFEAAKPAIGIAPRLPADATFTAGPFGRALHLAEQHAGVDADGEPGATFFRSFTSSIWVRLEPTLVDDMLFAVGSGEGRAAFTGWALGVAWHGYPSAIAEDGSYRGEVILQGPNRLCADRWTQLALTYAEGLITLFVDGQSVAATQQLSTRVLYGDQPFHVGNDENFGNRRLTGSVDEVRLWDHALTPAEVSAAYAFDACRAVF